MGRLIDADKLIEYWLTSPMNIGYDDEIEDVNNQPTIEAIPKADYKNRLKADMVAMLTELSIKIGEIEDGYTEFDEENKRSLTMIPLESVERLIDGKINSLKEKSNEL